MPYGETDLIVTLLTREEGVLGARFRGGRKSSKRATGGIEPIHTLDVLLEERKGELWTVKESRILKVRATLTSSLEAMEAAGTALRWARDLLPAQHVDPRNWDLLEEFLDALDTVDAGGGEGAASHASRRLAQAGFAFLARLGYALELGRCVVCGRVCPASMPAFVDAARGGVVCRACGGRGRLLDAESRRVATSAQLGEAPDTSALTDAQVGSLLALLRDAMAAHADR